jgi:lysine 6-dehydrogenase
MKITILGAGLIGEPMAIDLAKDNKYQITVADINETPLKKMSKDYPITTKQMDLSNSENVRKVIESSDLVINALPGFIGFQTLEAIIRAKKNVVDIAFFPEDPFLLDEMARRHNAIVLVDCGVSPGMSNILAGHVNCLLDETDNILTLVGGLPEQREWPYEYKAVFSPLDVIEEYTRPARYVENGKLVIKPALSDSEYINFKDIGTLEAFNSDGLRTLLTTINAQNMKEKTLRYPGHIEKMAMLRETGFFSQQEIQINGSRIRPLDFTSKILFPKWKLEEGEVDLTIMRVIIEGKKEKEKLRYTYDLFDRYDEATQTHSMARTTGYTATVATRMVLNGLYKKTGITAPEFIGKQPECVEFMLNGLKEKGVIFKETIEILD